MRCKAHMVVLHDAEDMVDPAALVLLDRAVWRSDFAQLPVMALPPSDSRWIASHYSDEFAESHAKAMVVRDALGCAIPGAGVGSAIARPMLVRLARAHQGEPFARHSLTEDYELGQRVVALGGTGGGCAFGHRAAGWSRPAPIFRLRWRLRYARRPAGCMASHCRAGTGSGGAGRCSIAG